MKADERRPSGVVDIGSNSVRLVVYQTLSRAPQAVFNERAICGIGRNLDTTGHLDPDGSRRALANLTRFASLASAMNVEQLDVLATAATRDAADGGEFLDHVKALFRRPVRQLNGDEEARLAGYGVLCGIPNADGFAGDLGGGSLELAALDAGQFADGHSLPLGHLRLLATTGDKKGGPAREMDTALAAAGDWLKGYSGRNFYAVGGAWRSIARLHMAQTEYPLRVIHNYSMTAGDAADFCRLIEGLGQESLARMKSVSRQRAETLPIAAQALRRMIKAVKPRQVIFSAFGIREGVLYERLGETERRIDPLLLVSAEIAARESRFGAQGDGLFTWSSPLFPEETPMVRRLRHAVCLLADIGWHEHPDYRAEQVYYRILRLPLISVTHAERARIALAVYRRYGGSMDDQVLRAANELLVPDEIAWATTLGDALRLAETLAGGMPSLLEDSVLELDDNTLTLRFTGAMSALNGDAVGKRFERVARRLKRQPELVIA